MKSIVDDDVVLSQPLQSPLSAQVPEFARWAREEGYVRGRDAGEWEDTPGSRGRVGEYARSDGASLQPLEQDAAKETGRSGPGVVEE